ncbi:uncharacterized protein LOC126821480 isoform X2 [Patella vulgata]|nr:uncharacterized protein LOC126821480 isoform X2 [Patella vulgata]
MMYITKSAAYYASSVILLVLSCDGCYTNYNNCQQQYFTAAGAASSSDPTLAQQQLCGAATTAKTCLDNDAANCPPGTVEPTGFTQIKTTINNTVISCEMSACAPKQQICSNQTLEAYNKLQTSNQAAFCAEMPIAVDCYRKVQMECPVIDLNSTIEMYSSLVVQTCGGGGGGNSNGCFQKVFECSNYSTEIADAVLSIDFTDESAVQSLSTTMCPTFSKITRCYSELTLMCPDPAFANVTSSLDAVKPTIEQVCGNDTGTQNGCLQKSVECSSVSRNILSIDFSDMSAIQNLTPMICSAMTNLTTCYNQLQQECPNLMPANATSPIDALKPMLDQMCGAGGNCLGCGTPFMASGCQNTSQDDYEGTYRCCGVSHEMLNCFKRNQCTQMPMFGDIQLFQLALERQCSGYQEYCPGLNACLSPFSTNLDLYTVCPRINSFMTCVNTACKDKPKVGDLTIMKIMPLYQQICTGLSAYPAIGTCQTFGTCTQNGVSALIAEPITLKSISAVGNPEHWCKMAKGI